MKKNNVLTLDSSPLMRMTPESQGADSREILKYVRELDASENEIHGIMIAKNNAVIAESWLSPYKPDYPHTCHSMGKSYTCTAVGIACTEGLLNPEDRIVDLLKEEIEVYGAQPDENFKKIKLRDVMAMGNGMPGMPEFNESWIENYLKSTVVYEPGTHFYYNSIGSCLLGAIVEKVTGKGIREYLDEKLFCKIGIDADDLVWLHFPDGTYAEPGVSATTESNLRLGLFYLSNGMASGQQIISEQWMKEATKKQIETAEAGGTDDYLYGYGWQLWHSSVPGLYRFDGGQGQLCMMYSKNNAAIAIHEGGVHPNGVQKVIELSQKALTSMQDGPLPENPKALAELQNYLNERTLQKGISKNVPKDAGKFNGTYYVKEGNINFWMEVIPVDEDFYHFFYDLYTQNQTKTIDFSVKKDHIMMTVNNKSQFKLWLDGRQEAFETYNVMAKLDKTCSSAYFEDPNTLIINIRWLNGWTCSKTRISLDGCNLNIVTEKDMLHEGRTPVIRRGIARRIGM